MACRVVEGIGDDLPATLLTRLDAGDKVGIGPDAGGCGVHHGEHRWHVVRPEGAHLRRVALDAEVVPVRSHFACRKDQGAAVSDLIATLGVAH